jgi:putative endopeptidase
VYDYPYLSNDSLLENIYCLATANYKSLIEQVRNPKLFEVWSKPIFNVNAHYSQNMNRILFPAAILETPFYIEHGSIGWNYGGIGATIGHEITHAFDRDGMMIDENGVKEPWYTNGDKEEYDKRAEDLMKIFDKVRVYGQRLIVPDIISEAIADLGGLGIALHALKKELLRRKASEKETTEEIRNFFISYAVSWRVKKRPKFLIQNVFTDEHPPAWTRVNHIVQHFQEFYDIFDVTSGQKLYLEPKERIRFF